MDAASGAIQGKGKVDVMEDDKLRMINEYKNLEEKYNKLHKMLVKYDAGKLDFTPTCPIDLLRKQASFMGQYLYILETRAVIEGIDLNAEEEKKEEKKPDTKYDDTKIGFSATLLNSIADSGHSRPSHRGNKTIREVYGASSPDFRDGAGR